jgi:hypothetical protein
LSHAQSVRVIPDGRHARARERETETERETERERVCVSVFARKKERDRDGTYPRTFESPSANGTYSCKPHLHKQEDAWRSLQAT